MIWIFIGEPSVPRGMLSRYSPQAPGERALRIELFDDTVERLSEIDTLTGEVTDNLPELMVFPANHYVTRSEKLQFALEAIRAELAEQLTLLRQENKLLEAQRLEAKDQF